MNRFKDAVKFDIKFSATYISDSQRCLSYYQGMMAKELLVVKLFFALLHELVSEQLATSAFGLD